MDTGQRGFKESFLLLLKGIGMGGADVVPGVSGGTIAFITGIYEELLESIKQFDLPALRFLFNFQFKKFWSHINGNFLVVLLSGIFLSLLTLSRLISYLLMVYPILVWSFFFGLIIISSISVSREIKIWNFRVVIVGIIGVAIAYYVTIATPAETSTELWFIFISGAIAICAMILPGISGSFILLIMGKYEYVLNAVRDFNIPVIVVFGIGCVVGILSFARLISWLLKNYHNTALALLAGFMVGSLNKIWPWKIVVAYRIDSDGIEIPLIERNIMPGEYAQSVGDPQTLWAILFIALGILLVIALEVIATSLKGRTPEVN